MSKPTGRERVTLSATAGRLAVAAAIVVTLANGLRADPSIHLTFGPFDSLTGKITVTANIGSTAMPQQGMMKTTVSAKPPGNELPQPREVTYKVQHGQLTFTIPFHRSRRLIKFSVVGIATDAAGALMRFKGSDSLAAGKDVLEPAPPVTPPTHSSEAHIQIVAITPSAFRLVGSIRPKEASAPAARAVNVIVRQTSGDVVRTDRLVVRGSEPFQFDLPVRRLESGDVEVDVTLLVNGVPPGAPPLFLRQHLYGLSPPRKQMLSRSQGSALILALVLVAILIRLTWPKLKQGGEKRVPGPVQEVSWRYSAFGPSRVILEIHGLPMHPDDILLVDGTEHPLIEMRSVTFDVAASNSFFRRTYTDLKITLHSATPGKAQIKVVARVFQRLRRYSVHDSCDLEFTPVSQQAMEPPGTEPSPPDPSILIGKLEQTPTIAAASVSTVKVDIPPPVETRLLSPPQSDAERNLLEAVNGWLRDEGMSRSDLMRAVRSRGLSATFYSMADIGRTVTDPRGRYRFREDQSNGAWLWQPLDSGVDFLAVPADDTSFVTLDVVTLLASLYDGVPLNRSRVEFAEILRACRVRTESEGEYVVANVGSLRIRSGDTTARNDVAPPNPQTFTSKHHDERTEQDRIAVAMRAKQVSWDETREHLETTIDRQREALKTSSDENARLKRQIEQLHAEKRVVADVQAVRQERELLRKGREALDQDRRILDSSRVASKAEIDRGLKALEESQQQLDRGLKELKESQQQLDRDDRALKEREERLDRDARVLQEREAQLEAKLDGLREALGHRTKAPRIAAQHEPAAELPPTAGTPSDAPSLLGATSSASQERSNSVGALERSTSGSATPSGATVLVAPTTPDAGFSFWPDREQLNAWINALATAFPEVAPEAKFVPKLHLESLLGMEEILRNESRSSDLEITLAHMVGGTGSPPLYDLRLLPLSPPAGALPNARLGGLQEGLWIQLFVAVKTRAAPDNVLIFAPPGAYEPVSFASYSGLIANFPPSRFVINRLERPARLRLDAKSGRYQIVEKMQASFA